MLASGLRADCRSTDRAEFVANMEQVLDLYQQTLRSGLSRRVHRHLPDEQPVQLVKETRPRMAAHEDWRAPACRTHEYERAGTASVFLFSEPLAGWRQATARARRTKVDWALEVADACWKDATPTARRSPWCATTSTRSAEGRLLQSVRADPGTGNWFVALSSAYVTRETRGPWLNIAENELSAMTRQ